MPTDLGMCLSQEPIFSSNFMTLHQFYSERMGALCLYDKLHLNENVSFVVVVVLLFYVRGKHLRSCCDSQLA